MIIVMIPSIEKVRSEFKKDTYVQERLAQLYAAMDSTYKEAADFYKFKCTGCKDNCCFTRFYHHTFIEYCYLLDGFDTLENEKKMEIKKRADEVCTQLNKADQKGLPVWQMCPLNFDSLCCLYSYRPMICRLHGVPHELTIPGQEVQCHPGCDYFAEQRKEKKYFRFDRTPIYAEMADLEKNFRQKTGIVDKIKMTVPEMIYEYDF